MISYKVLHHVLTENDDTELKYLADITLPDYSQMDSVMVDGESTYVLPSAGSSTFPYAPHPNIQLVKNSRYRPVANHMHAWIELGYMFSGSCEHRVNQKTYTLKQGQIFILDCNTPHSLGNMGKNDILVSMLMKKSFFTDAFFNHFSEESVLSRFLVNSISERTAYERHILFRSERNRRITNYMSELMCEHVEPSVHSKDIIDALISLLFLELINVYEADLVVEGLQTNQPNILPILKYIETNYRTCTLTSTAEFFHINGNYLTSMLKRNTGLSFKELIQKQRFRSISHLLRNTSLSVNEIAQMSGYTNITYFYKKFQEEFHCSPGEYRAGYQEAPGDEALPQTSPQTSLT